MRISKVNDTQFGLRILTNNVAILWRKYDVLYRADASRVSPIGPAASLDESVLLCFELRRIKPVV